MKKKIWFNGSERDICKCGNPEGFCKHTIESEYKERCVDTPKKPEDIWQLIRSHAIDRTYVYNLWINHERALSELESQLRDLKAKVEQQRVFNQELKQRLQL